MRATGVIVRFLSLLDVFLVLFGVMLIALLHAQVQSATQESKSTTNPLAEALDLDFIYLFAGWKGAESGRCYLVGSNREIGREVRTDTAEDIREILTSRAVDKERKNQLVLLLFSDDGWYSAWDAQKLQGIEETWKLKVVPVYNVRLVR
jgi:hypothetical protein